MFLVVYCYSNQSVQLLHKDIYYMSIWRQRILFRFECKWVRYELALNLMYHNIRLILIILNFAFSEAKWGVPCGCSDVLDETASRMRHHWEPLRTHACPCSSICRMAAQFPRNNFTWPVLTRPYHLLPSSRGKGKVLRVWLVGWYKVYL